MKKFILLAIVFLPFAPLKAQQKDTVLKNQTIEIIQSYKPSLKQATKPVFSPDVPPVDTTSPVFEYEVPQQVLSYSYNAMPIKPLALGKDSLTASTFPYYIKFGAGNLSTVYLDAGAGYHSNEKYNGTLHLHHLQQQGSLKYQQTAFSGLDANGSLLAKTMRYNGSFNVLRNQYALFGGFVDTAGAAPKHTYTGASFAVDAINIAENNLGLHYNPSLKIGVYGRKGITETMANIAIPVSKKLDDNFMVSAAMSLELANLSMNNFSSYSNNIVQFIPKLAYENEGIKAHISIKPTLGKGDKGYLLPDIYLSYKVPNATFGVFAGWNGTLQQNSFQQLSTYNPYLSSGYLHYQTKQDDVFGGIRFGLGKSFYFSGKLSHKDYKNLPLFINNFTGDNGFSILYDDVKAVSIEANLRYEIADIFTIKLSVTSYNFYEHTFYKVYHEPSLRFNADFSFRPSRNLIFTAYSRVLDGIYAYVPTAYNQTVKSKSAFDVGVGTEYNIIPRLSIFLNVNNLFNNKYERWYHYEAYGFNIFGGLRVKF